MYKVLVCGSRKFAVFVPQDHPMRSRYQAEHEWVMGKLELLAFQLWPRHEEDKYGNWLPDVVIISGAAKGIDSAAIDWAMVNYLPFREYPADWKAHGKAAGPIRNQQMLDEEHPDVVVAFKGGVGTADMVRRAEKAGIPVIHIEDYPNADSN